MRVILVYNVKAMQTETRNSSAPRYSSVERDSGLFFIFLTLVIASIYVITLVETPSVRQPGMLFIFSAALLVHLLLHWLLIRIADQPRHTTWYTLFQGALAFGIGLLAKSTSMAFVLFMALLGEGIGLLGLKRKGILAAAYYLALLVVNLILLLGWAAAGPFLMTAIPVSIFVILFVSLYMRQNEAREQAQTLADELESANRRLAEYASQVEELTLAAERQRMARELHDTLSQGLAGLVLQLEAVKAHLEVGHNERAGEIIEQSLGRARSTLADSRAAIDDLRAIPANLSQAIRVKTERFTQATGIPCELNLDLGDIDLPQDASDHLLRVLNEALANVTRHAQANQVWVELGALNGQLELEIRDDGQGFNPGKEHAAGHYGLLGMRERARLLGGILQVESGSGRGARICLALPIPKDD